MENIHQKISQFLDDDLNLEESLELCKLIQQNPELQQTLYSYQTTQEILTTKTVPSPNPNFLNSIQNKLHSEVNYLIPKTQKPTTYKPPNPTLITTLAASIATLSVLIFNHTIETPTPIQTQPIATLKVNNELAQLSISELNSKNSTRSHTQYTTQYFKPYNNQYFSINNPAAFKVSVKKANYLHK